MQIIRLTQNLGLDIISAKQINLNLSAIKGVTLEFMLALIVLQNKQDRLYPIFKVLKLEED